MARQPHGADWPGQVSIPGPFGLERGWPDRLHDCIVHLAHGLVRVQVRDGAKRARERKAAAAAAAALGQRPPQNVAELMDRAEEEEEPPAQAAGQDSWEDSATVALHRSASPCKGRTIATEQALTPHASLARQPCCSRDGVPRRRG